MNKQKKDFTKIVHISRDTHSKLKRYVVDKQLSGSDTTLSRETEIAIVKHVKKKSWSLYGESVQGSIPLQTTR